MHQKLRSVIATHQKLDCLMSEVGPLVKQARKRLGLRQVEFGQRLGVTKIWVSFVECGRKKPSADMLVKILELLEEGPTP